MTILFIGLLIMIFTGVGIIVFSKNVVHAAYAIALTLVGLSGIYVLLHSELLAIVQILLYAGGVVILLAFGIMMTSRLGGEVKTKSKNKLSAALLSASLFGLLVYLISSTDFPQKEMHPKEPQIAAIGIAFLTDHLVAFELVAFILLVVLVGAAYLAKMASNE